MSRICFFKIHGQNGLALASSVSTLSDAVDAKADAVDLTTLEGVVEGKAAASSVYTKTEADALLSDKLEAADISAKANSADVYTIGESDTLLSVKLVAADISGKANTVDIYSQQDVDAMLSSKLEASDISGKLNTSVYDTRKTAENAFFLAMSESLYVESAPSSGTEFVYTTLLA